MDCKTCNEPAPTGREFCSRSCAVEAEILEAEKPLPALPKLPALSSSRPPTLLEGRARKRDSMQHGYTPAPSEPNTPIEQPKPGGLKFDDGKIPLHLLPFDSLIEIARVLQFGAKKYAPNNWRKGIVYSRLFRAAIGHLISWWMGQDLDEETGISHLAHAGCCVVFLLHYALRGGGNLDDRAENNA